MPAPTALVSHPKNMKFKVPILSSLTSTVEVVSAAAGAAPIPYIKTAFEVLAMVLKTIEARTMKQNREDMQDLYETVQRFHAVFEEHCDIEGERASELNALCQKMRIRETMNEVCDELDRIRKTLLSRSVGSRVRGYFGAKPISETIRGLQKKVEATERRFNTAIGLDTNREVRQLRSYAVTGAGPADVTGNAARNHVTRLLILPAALGSLPQKLVRLHTDATSKIAENGDDDPRTLDVLNDLAQQYSEVGQHTPAIEIRRHILRAYQRLRGNDNALTLTAMNNLAVSYIDVRRLDEAEVWAKNAVDGRKKLLGERAADTLRSMGNLALVYSLRNEHERAKDLQRTVYWGRKAALGADHPETMAASTQLATTYRKLRRPQDARKYQQRALDTLGEDHPDSLPILVSLAITCGELKDFGEAERLKIIVLERLRGTKGDAHLETLRAAMSLAVTYKDRKLPRKAKVLERDTLEQLRRNSGDDHPDTLECVQQLAETHYQLEEFEQSAELEEDLLRRYSKLFGEDDSRSQRVMRNLIMTYDYLKRTTQAEDMRIRLERARGSSSLSR
ncbi:hypothetical protein HMN09_00387200 [Mycena chlorophos]|uniref:Kinesin light chain n=1 Tax=Mycena chlorophos TaxID=658473 RepID=A0A8H6WHF0_MYCCL|nr:hypothetical protein HMN09_00387200 [Mycena chlorophos]